MPQCSHVCCKLDLLHVIVFVFELRLAIILPSELGQLKKLVHASKTRRLRFNDNRLWQQWQWRVIFDKLSKLSFKMMHHLLIRWAIPHVQLLQSQYPLNLVSIIIMLIHPLLRQHLALGQCGCFLIEIKRRTFVLYTCFVVYLFASLFAGVNLALLLFVVA